jgi:ferredoxin
MILDTEKCNACGLCARECPLGAVTMNADEIPQFGENCVVCGLCVSVCPVQAIAPPPKDNQAAGYHYNAWGHVSATATRTGK